MSYEEFINKWVGRRLYDSDFSGIITIFENQELILPYGKALVDIFITPKWSGWKDDKQRKVFYRDAKLVGVRVKPKVKNEWYKVKDLL